MEKLLGHISRDNMCSVVEKQKLQMVLTGSIQILDILAENILKAGFKRHAAEILVNGGM